MPLWMYHLLFQDLRVTNQGVIISHSSFGKQQGMDSGGETEAARQAGALSCISET